MGISGFVSVNYMTALECDSCSWLKPWVPVKSWEGA